MISGLHFLIAAKHCEIAQLEGLAATSALVDTTGRLVHALQRERGLSSVYLASPHEAAHADWLAQVQTCLLAEDELRACYENLHTPQGAPGHGARLFNRMAYAVQGLDALPLLRDHVAARRWPGARSTAAYVKLVAGLLAVVFEAADSATDPAVSRLLVVLFNWMQGKELAGQERATGSALFASGQASGELQQRWLNLIDAQARCFQVCQDFSGSVHGASLTEADMKAGIKTGMQASEETGAEAGADIERLRRVGTTALEGSALDPTLSPRWFDLCTRRMNTMRQEEERLTQALNALCHAQVAAARLELGPWAHLQAQSLQQVLADVAQLAHPDGADNPAGFFDETTTPTQRSTPHATRTGLTHGPQLDQSILDMVHEQAQRLQNMAAELDTVRASLNERKLVERAKGMLMAHRHLSEMEAHKLLRQTAMNQGRRLGDVAETVLAMADLLPALP